MSNTKWAGVERLFHAVMERPFEQRDAYLKEAASSENEYDAVRKLIDVAQRADDFMQTSMGLGAFSPSLDVGQTLGVWTVLETIGSGGMGEIYRVKRQGENFTQIAALKVARTQDSRYLLQFERERRILAQLEHPNIGRFIDGGTGPYGNPYIVMELVDGQPITAYIDALELSPPARLRLFKQLCQAASHAHSRLVLHRDIKPPNIMVTSSGQIKLIDFGTSEAVNADNSVPGPVTRAYASPEQLRGEQVTTATDIYALGAVLHRIMSGERPGIRKNISDGLPTDLQAIIRKCLTENPQDRYGTVDGLQDDIDRFLQNRPVQAQDNSRFYRLRKSISRNRMAFTASALLAVSLVGGLVGTYSQMRKAQKAFQETQAAKLEQEFEARTLAGYSYGLQTLYGTAEGQVEAIDPAKIDASMIRLAETAIARYDGKSLDDAFLLYSMGQVLANRYDFENAARFLEPLRNLPTDTPITQSLSFEARSDLARYWGEMGQTDNAERLIRALLTEREDQGMTFDLGHVQDTLGLASLTGSSEDLDNAINVSLKTLQKWEENNTDTDDLSWLYNQVGTAYFKKDDISKAINAFEKSFQLNRQSGIQSLDDITSATNLAQFQIYLDWDGLSPLEYLTDYLWPALNEFGAPHVYAFIQGLRAEAALLNDDWVLAADSTQDGMPFIADNRSFRDGWYYEMAIMRARALTQLSRTEEARQFLDITLQEFRSESNISGWGFTACKVHVIDGYTYIFQGKTAKGRAIFDEGVKQCRAASSVGWDKEPVLPRWISDLEAEITRVNNQSARP